MHESLIKAHQVLDKAVDAAYGYRDAASNSNSDSARVAFLFERYQQLTSLLPVEKAKKSRNKKIGSKSRQELH